MSTKTLDNEVYSFIKTASTPPSFDDIVKAVSPKIPDDVWDEYLKKYNLPNKTYSISCLILKDSIERLNLAGKVDAIDKDKETAHWVAT